MAGTVSSSSGASISLSAAATGIARSPILSAATRIRVRSGAMETARKPTRPSYCFASFSSSGNSRAQVPQPGIQRFTSHGRPRIVCGVTLAPSRRARAERVGQRTRSVGPLARRAEHEREEDRKTTHAGDLDAFTRFVGLARCGRPLPVLEPTLPPPDLPEPPVPAERLGWLALVGALALFFLLGVPLQMLSTGVGIWFTELFLFFGFGWALTRWSGRAPAPYLGLSWPGGWPLVLALGVAVANYFAAVIPLQFLAQLVAPRSWVEMFDQTQVFERQAGHRAVPRHDRRGGRGAHRRGGHLPRPPAPGPAAPGRGRAPRGDRRGGHLQPLPRQHRRASRRCSSWGWCSGCSTSGPGACSRAWWRIWGATSPRPCSTRSGRGRSPRRSRPPRSSRRCWRRALLGWIVLALVLALARRVPEAWGRPAETEVLRPRIPLSRALAALGRRGRGLASSSGASPTGAASSSTSRTRGSGCRPRGQRAALGARPPDRAGHAPGGRAPGKGEPGALPRGPPRAGRALDRRGRRTGVSALSRRWLPALRAPCSCAPGAPDRPSRCPSPRRPRRRRSPPAALP